MTVRNQLLASATVLCGLAVGLLAWAYLPKYSLPLVYGLGYLAMVGLFRHFPAKKAETDKSPGE